MSRLIKKFFTCWIAAMALTVFGPLHVMTAFAASAQVTFSDPKPSVGEEFSVTVQVATSDGNLGASDIVLAYDPAVIEFVSGTNANGGAGTVRLVGTMDSGATKSISHTLKFKALQAGNTTVSVTSTEIYDADMQAMTVSHTGSSSVKVQAPATYSSEASLASLKISPGSLSPAFSPEVTSYSASVGADVNKIAVSAGLKDPKAKIVVSGDKNLKAGSNQVICKVTAEDGTTVKTYTIAVTKAEGGTEETAESGSEEETQALQAGELTAEIDGQTFYVAASFDDSLLPGGFTASTADYQGSQVKAGIKDDMTILYLQDSEGGGGFYFYDSADGVFSPCASIHVSEKNIIVLPVDESVEIPEGFTETTIQLNGDYKVEGWVWGSDTEQRYCVVYAMNENGEKGLYRYDIGEKTIQRYFEDPALQSSYSDEEVDAFIDEYNAMYKLYRLRLVIIVALAAVCVVLMALVLILLKKKGTGPRDRGRDPEDRGGSRRGLNQEDRGSARFGGSQGNRSAARSGEERRREGSPRRGDPEQTGNRYRHRSVADDRSGDRDHEAAGRQQAAAVENRAVLSTRIPKREPGDRGREHTDRPRQTGRHPGEERGANRSGEGRKADYSGERKEASHSGDRKGADYSGERRGGQGQQKPRRSEGRHRENM